MELASFQNPAGLLPLGGNLFGTTTASGEPTTGAPGADGTGTVAQGFLEQSNVSIVEEMVNMILGQRAYEANAPVQMTDWSRPAALDTPSRRMCHALRAANAERLAARRSTAQNAGVGVRGLTDESPRARPD